jgi:DNA-binding SARP family transcriptional activator/TolB-like protein
LDDLQTVYERGRSRVGEGVWPRLTAHEQAVAVYQELRALDSDRFDRFNQAFTNKEEFVSTRTTGHAIVRLRLVGQMDAWAVSGENVLPTGRKTRALLAAIALSAPRPALRGRLAELLWSRRPEEQARASLRQEIQLLLRALTPAKTEILRVTRDHLSLMPGVVWIDAEEITRGANSRPAALALLDGELLEDLEGVDPAFDMWLTGERERLRDRARGMAEVLLREPNQPDAIIAAAQRLLQIDRAHEEAWRALMRAHADQGERGMAIQAYDRCRAVLADLLDAEPSAETQSLLQEIRGPSSKRLPTRPPHPVPERATEEEPELTATTSIAERSPRTGARICVLPLRCVGLSDDIAYLGPSLANEITTALSRFRWMSVVSSNALVQMARDNHVTATIRRPRDIDFLLDGAIQRSRNNLRVTLRLLDLRQDNQVVWARRFDRPADDPLVTQEEISGEVAAQIDPVMLAIEVKRALTHPTESSSAYDLILSAAPLIVRLERGGFTRAGEFLARAASLEPDHAAAHAWHAAWHVLLICQGWASDPGRAGARAIELAERAIVLDPFSAGVFAVAGHVRAIVQRNPQEAVALHERALELNPNFAVAWVLSAISNGLLGETKEAERRYQRYRVLSPVDPYSFMFDGMFASVHVMRRDYQSAVTIGRSVTQLNPSYATGFKPYLAALGHLGAGKESAAVLRRLRLIEPDITAERCLIAFPLARDVDREHFLQGLRLAGMR